MKIKLLASVFALVATMGVAHADDMMDARKADESTVNKRQVTYQCQGKKSIKVTYGFNKQNQPTYAQATLNGKTRFMPINLAHSDNVDTWFGNDNNFNLSTPAMTLANYHKTSIATIQDPASNILYKDCQVKSSKKVH
ncbi:MAG: adhesin [Moraxella sp.]|uniref:ACP-like domain-containing protein n=1 Tax=Moraxella sp. TaxID=479 RepID=UPI0026DBE1CE|nr:adhesin [Moraxella sp.]MDO4451175.1 adhesin [Moraxella sp.]